MKSLFAKFPLILCAVLLISGTNSYSAQPPVPHNGLNKFQTGVLLGLTGYLWMTNCYCATHNLDEAFGSPRTDIGGICHNVPGNLPMRIVQHMFVGGALGPIIEKLWNALLS